MLPPSTDTDIPALISVLRALRQWLNTCVGGSNYHLFFTSMTFALLLLAYQLAISLFLFISTFEDNYLRESAHAYIRAAYGSFDGVLLQVLLCVLVVISAPLVLSLLQLFLLHVYLWQRKITTYEVSGRAVRAAECGAPMLLCVASAMKAHMFFVCLFVCLFVCVCVCVLLCRTCAVDHGAAARAAAQGGRGEGARRGETDAVRHHDGVHSIKRAAHAWRTGCSATAAAEPAAVAAAVAAALAERCRVSPALR